MRITRRNVLLGSAAALASPALVRAQETLPETMRLIMPFPSGNSLDGSARVFSEAYRAATGRNCFVENKPGAAATIAAYEVARAKPDGSTILWTTGGHITTAVLMKKLPYDPIQSFTPLTPVSLSDGFALVTRPGSPWNSVKDVIEAAKRSPGRVTYASAGVGNTSHVVGAMFARSAGVDMLHIPYKGDFLTDLVSGVIDASFISPGVISPWIKGGKLKMLGLTGTVRSETYPEVPNFSEFGLSDMNILAYSAVFAPPRMPPATLSALHDGIVKAVKATAFANVVALGGGKVWTLSPVEFKEFLQKEQKEMQRILPALGIQIDS